uniref:Uncharacterized protein n=1 Tax=Manihot esculenta TaxID=3983 RepID=A0A2C9VF54_MANES
MHAKSKVFLSSRNSRKEGTCIDKKCPFTGNPHNCWYLRHSAKIMRTLDHLTRRCIKLPD